MPCSTGNAVQTYVRLIHPIDAYQTIQADYATHVRLKSMAVGCRMKPDGAGHQPLTDIANDSCVEYRDLNFGEEESSLRFVADLCRQAGGCIELALDDPEAETVATLVIPSSERGTAVKLETSLPPILGMHTLYLRFHSCHRAAICKLNSFCFVRDSE